MSDLAAGFNSVFAKLFDVNLHVVGELLAVFVALMALASIVVTLYSIATMVSDRRASRRLNASLESRGWRNMKTGLPVPGPHLKSPD